MDANTKKKITAIIEKHQQDVEQLLINGIESIASAAEMIVESLKAGGCVYICGNGGSAADAQHIAGELVGRFEHQRKGLAAVALTTDTSTITSVSNDYGYENIFVRQVEALVKKGDILWGISTSGESANVLAAAELAKGKGAKVIGFTGKAGSKLEEIADVCLCANETVTARSQEIHQLGYHIICSLVEEKFLK